MHHSDLHVRGPLGLFQDRRAWPRHFIVTEGDLEYTLMSYCNISLSKSTPELLT